jgi:predicted transcriptional regulator
MRAFWFLEGIRARHRLKPIEISSATVSQDDVIRIICSDGLV